MTKGAAALAGAALTATAQAGVTIKGAAAQAGMLPNAVAQPEVLRKMALTPAGRTLRRRLPKQRLLRYYWSSTTKSETKTLVNRAL